MKHKFLDKSVIDIDAIEYISQLCGYTDRFYYHIYLKSGKQINQELYLYINHEKNTIHLGGHNNYPSEPMVEDIRDCVFYKEFKYNYDRLLEKFLEK